MRRLVALLAGALLLTACGGDGGGRFDEQVQAVRDAVEAGDRDAALAELDAISLLAADAHGSGDLTDAEAEELAGLLAQGRALVDQELPAPTTTTTTTTTTAPPPVVQEGGGEDDEERGKGKGKKGDDDEGDDD